MIKQSYSLTWIPPFGYGLSEFMWELIVWVGVERVGAESIDVKFKERISSKIF